MTKVQFNTASNAKNPVTMEDISNTLREIAPVALLHLIPEEHRKDRIIISYVDEFRYGGEKRPSMRERLSGIKKGELEYYDVINVDIVRTASFPKRTDDDEYLLHQQHMPTLEVREDGWIDLVLNGENRIGIRRVNTQEDLDRFTKALIRRPIDILRAKPKKECSAPENT